MRITFKRDARETGLARVCQGPRGYEIRADGKRVGHVSPLCPDRWIITGWYWYCAANDAMNIELRNTAKTPVKTVDEAKAQAKAYIVECLKASSKAGKP